MKHFLRLFDLKAPFPIRYSPMKVISTAILLYALTTGVAFAALVTFDDLPTPADGGTVVVPNGYMALTWANVSCLNAANNNLGAGYNNAAVSRPNVAFMGFDDPGQFVLVSGPTFDFVSAWLTAAWRNGLNVRVRGFLGGVNGTLRFDRSVIVNTSGPTFFNFNYLGIDTLRFDTSGGVPGPFGDGGRHFVMDDLFIKFPGEPTAQNASVSVAANRTTSFALQASDPNGDPLTFRLVSLPSHGIISAIGAVSAYTPEQDYLGPDSFEYVVSDGRFTSSRARVNITVKPGFIINNASITEGNSGTKMVNFTVSATVCGGLLDDVEVSYGTSDGTARAGSDYVSIIGGRLALDGSDCLRSITIPVIGDRTIEADETFLVTLSSPSANAVIASGTGRCTILNDDSLLFFQVGTAGLTPEDSVVSVGEPVNLRLDWTHPVGWRQLDSVDLLLSDNEGTVLRARWHEAANAFSLFNSRADKFLGLAEAGRPAPLENSVASLQVRDSTGGGLPGQTVTIDYSLIFKPQAAGRTFSVEAFATDDAGDEQGFESVGAITVLPR